MPYRYESDDPQEINLKLSIQISYPRIPLQHNDEYFWEKKEEASIIINALKELEITDYKLRYCVVIDGEFGEYTYRRDRHARFNLVPGPPQWNEIGQFIAQITAEISKSLPEMDALVDIITRVVKAVFTLLHREKKRQEGIGLPSVTIGFDGHFVKVEGPDQEKNVESVKRLVEDLFKERLGTSTNQKTKISGKLAGSSHYRRRRKSNGGKK
ncbi:MAG TPA: hypothetical protein VEL70_01980 [Candidatus Acidoferrum sp.]|nr:hypothetical protein [Candidatus Acidoferrum sp.]